MTVRILFLVALLGAAVTPAAAAPPLCDRILDAALRQNCIERAQRCEPIRNAAEREQCYRGPRSVRRVTPTGG